MNITAAQDQAACLQSLVTWVLARADGPSNLSSTIGLIHCHRKQWFVCAVENRNYHLNSSPLLCSYRALIDVRDDISWLCYITKRGQFGLQDEHEIEWALKRSAETSAAFFALRWTIKFSVFWSLAEHAGPWSILLPGGDPSNLSIGTLLEVCHRLQSCSIWLTSIPS